VKLFATNLSIKLIRLLKLCAGIVIVLTAVLLISNYFGLPVGSNTVGIIKALNNGITFLFITQIKAFIPYSFFGRDFSGAILIALLYMLSSVLSSMLFELELIQNGLVFNYKRKNNSPQESTVDSDDKSVAFSAETPKDRNELLQEFIALKSKLDAMGQHCAFLAVDVVDSTGMKAGEDKHLTIYDFDRYNQIAIACLFDNGVVKYATTPDGIMSCFRSVDHAVKAATDLLKKLEIFNLNEKQIKRDFEVRCGINAGFVFIEDMPLEQVTDQVIDIAGHMQKYAKPNTIYLSGSAFEFLKNGKGFNETTEIIDGQKVYVWGNEKQKR
jgi:class 3 adenylate cyclase